MKIKILRLLNKVFPKFKCNLIIGNSGNFMEAQCLELANYFSQNSAIKTYFVIGKENQKSLMKLLNKDVVVVSQGSLYYYWLLLTSKYIFKIFGNPMDKSSKRQKVIHVWHGIPIKAEGKIKNPSYKGVPADLTVATSELTKTILADSFGVSEDSMIITGYPRNDIMIRAKRNKMKIREIVELPENYEKIIIWLPTYRKDYYSNQDDGEDLNNPFQIKDFDIAKFERELKSQNALCLVKPHPRAIQNYDYKFENIKIINDNWLLKKGITLYHLLALADILVSDFSSVIIDFLLMDKPIICFNTDFEEYKQNRGFSFDNIEEMLPSPIIQDQESFFNYLNMIFEENDPSEEKRLYLKKQYFKYYDDRSSERILNCINNNL